MSDASYAGPLCPTRVYHSGGRIVLLYRVLKRDQPLAATMVPRRGLAQSVSEALDLQGFLPPAGAECVLALCTCGKRPEWRLPMAAKWVGQHKVQRNHGGSSSAALRRRTTERRDPGALPAPSAQRRGVLRQIRKSDPRVSPVTLAGEAMHGRLTIADYTRSDCHHSATASLKLTIN